MVSKENDFVIFERVQYCTVMIMQRNLGADKLIGNHVKNLSSRERKRDGKNNTDYRSNFRIWQGKCGAFQEQRLEVDSYRKA